MIELIPDLGQGPPEVQSFVRDRLQRYAAEWDLPCRDDLSAPGRSAAVARGDEGSIVGCVVYFRFPTCFASTPRFFVDFVWVEPDCRGSGLAQDLLGMVRQQGGVMLRVLIGNGFMKHFRNAPDWKEVGQRPRSTLFENVESINAAAVSRS